MEIENRTLLLPATSTHMLTLEGSVLKLFQSYDPFKGEIGRILDSLTTSKKTPWMIRNG